MTVAGQVCKLFLLMVNLVVLGRLLTPAEFGVVAVATALVGVAELLRDFGLSAASIQAKSLSDKQQGNLFWASVVLGLALLLVSLAIAFPAEILLGIPGLGGVVCGLGGVFFLNAVQTQFQVRLSREHRFGAVAATDVTGQCVGLIVGCVLALEGAGPWSLVGLQVSASFVVLILRVFSTRWIPPAVDRSVSIRSFISFGANLGLAQVLSYSVNALPAILIGKFSGVVQAGEFGRAFQIYSLPINQILSPLTNVVLANFANRDSTAEYSSFSAKVLKSVGLVGAFCGSFIFVFSSEIVAILLGSQWSGAANMLQVVSIGIPAQALALVYFWNFVSLGSTASLLRYNMLTKSVLGVSLIIAAFFGTFAILVVLVSGLWLSWLVCAFWFKTEEKVNLSVVWSVGSRVAGLTLGSGCFGFQMKLYFEHLNVGFLSVVYSAIAYLVAFCLIAMLLRMADPGVFFLRRILKSLNLVGVKRSARPRSRRRSDDANIGSQ
ncbi:oligosaccharide flippase family protein [Rhodococcus sp. P1Y]|uniref:oligosaccharide flippase family protein n=1 Tax=Rhodococcus sp. P1Y TaxID=1302308 RepID=UPI00137941DD|nr:oligosaccharide flippase family protein [Rhodococcus sp. P1Y]